MASNPEIRESFSSKFGIFAAVAGSAVGLGNIWRFPYVLGENGGGAFLLLYLLFVLVIGVPVMISEFLIGRKARLNIFGAFKLLAPGKRWYLVGVMGVGVAFMILAFYSVVAGWTLHYVFLAFTNKLAGKSPSAIIEVFDTLKVNLWIPVFWTLVFLALTAFIVRSGIKNGIEKYTKILMPVLFVIILLLDFRAITLNGATKGLAFLFSPDFSSINGRVILEALGQAFFSLSIGMGVLATYGSYIRKSDSLGGTAISVALADTIIAVLAGVAIFPAAFAFGLEPGQGPGLVFVTLPNIFNQMTGGYFFALLFFVLLSIAALTSSISLLEVVVAYFVEQLKMTRKTATWVGTGAMAFFGILCALYSQLFSAFDFISSNIILPLGGFFVVIFVGFVLGKNSARQEMEADGKRARYIVPFMFIVKFVAPIAIAMVFLNGLGLLNFLFQ